MIGFGEKQRAFGEGAQTQFLRNMKNTISNVKAVLGRAFNDPVTQRELKRLGGVRAVEQKDGSVGFEVSLGGTTQVFSATTVAAMCLRHLKALMERYLKSRVEDVVISIPVHWNNNQRRALYDAARIAGLNPLRLLHDSTATALQYGFFRQKELPVTDDKAIHVLFVDHGYSKTTATVVQFVKGKVRIVASESDPEFGSREIDQILFDHFAAEFVTKFKVDVRQNAKATERLLQACDKVKKVISATPTAPISIDCIMNDVDVKGLITREEFDELLVKANAAERLLAPVKRALQLANLPLEQVHSLEISGSGLRSTQMQRVLQTWFGRELSRTTNAEESIVRGCALQCAILSPVMKAIDVAIFDVVQTPIVLKWHETAAGAAAEETTDVFPAPVAVPSSKFVTLPNAVDYTVRAEYASAPASGERVIAQYHIKAAPHKEGASGGKIKLKVTLNPSGLFVLESAEQNETYTVEEEVPIEEAKKLQAAAAATTTTTTGDRKDTAMDTDEPTPAAAADATTPAAADGAATPAADGGAATPAADAPKTQKVQKKKVHRVILAFDEQVTGALSKRQLELEIEDEAKLVAQDKLAVETSDAKNAVETYIYAMRAKIEGELKEYSTEEERAKLLPLLQETEDWLYADGDDETKSVYVRKLTDMQAIGEKAVARHREAEHDRPVAVKALQQLAQEFSLRAKTDLPEYAHISAEDKQKVINAADEATAWLNGHIDAQLKLAKTAEPSVKASELDARRKTLELLCRPIMNQPKPKPKPEEKKPEEKKAEEPAKNGEQPAAADAGAAKSEPASTAEPMAEDK
jgi:heat shock protein 4